MEILTALRLVGPDEIFSIVPEKTVICDSDSSVGWFFGEYAESI
jgi:hypothetical protein